ncbi:MAG: formylglycine-generating enzyme family protein [Planctomycetota bacterium]
MPIGHPFRARFARTETGLNLITVNGDDLETPMELSPSSDSNSNYFVATEYKLDAVHRGVEVWAYEYGTLLTEKPNANDPDRRSLRFRSRVIVERAVMTTGNDHVFPIPKRLPTDVNVDQLTDDVAIRGRLSEKLGTWNKIKGRWSETTNFKGGSHRWAFEVIEVNGVKFGGKNAKGPDESQTILELTKWDIRPCEFSGMPDLEPRDGEIWELDAYETFRYNGFPVDVTKLWTIMTMYPRSGGRYAGLEWRRVVVREDVQVAKQTPSVVSPRSLANLEVVSSATTKPDLPLSSSKPSSTQPAKLQDAASRSFQGAKAGDAKKLNGIAFRWCPPGTFTMGEESGVVEVELSSGFWLGETEVTHGQWRNVIGTAEKKVDESPLVDVSHDDAASFCQKLTIQERSAGRLPNGWKYSLPTEAQWEYGCRAGTKTTYSFGDSESQLEDYAWFQANSDGEVIRVGEKKPNNWGLRDMHGNVWEWSSDWWDSKLPGGRDPVGASSGSNRVLRGGGWFDVADSCRTAIRTNYPYGNRRFYIGFRLAIVPE